MLSNFLVRFGSLLVLTNLLNEEFRLHFLCNFLITLTYPSTIFLHLLCLCLLRQHTHTRSLACNWQTVHDSVPASACNPEGRRPLGDPTPPVDMVPRLLWLVAIAMLLGVTIGPERVGQLSLSIDISYACIKNCPERWQCNTATMVVWLNYTKL